MTPDLLKAFDEFMRRVTLQGGEVPVFMAVMRAVHVLSETPMQPAANPGPSAAPVLGESGEAQ